MAALRTGSRKVFAINPLAASRYRDRHGVSRKKSDPGDALVLANILRTDMHAHRPLPADSELVQAITVLARAQQDAVWSRQQVANQVRSLLREYYPAALHAFQGKDGGLTRADARMILTLAPTPAKAAKLTLAQLRAALKRSGRTRAFDTETARLRDIFRSEYARQLPAVEDAFGHSSWPCSSNWTPPARPRTTLPRPPKPPSASTPTARSCSAFPASAPCSRPASLPRSATTAAASPMRERSSPTPAPPRSPAPLARNASSAAASSRTTGSCTRASSGPSQPSRPHPERTPTTGADASTATGTTPPSATCSTASSASSITASRHGSHSTNNALSHRSAMRLRDRSPGRTHCRMPEGSRSRHLPRPEDEASRPDCHHAARGRTLALGAA